MHTRIAKVLIAIAAAVFVIGAVEIAVRALGLAPDIRMIDVTDEASVYKRSTNPVLGFELKASYRNTQADLFTSYPSTNAHGQRDVERSLVKPSGGRRILLVGASVVEGVGIRNVDDTISRQLERMYGAGTEVLNFGVSAYCTAAKVELLAVKGLTFDPDAVVLFFSQNDFNNFNHEAFQLGSPVDRPAIVDRLFVESHLFRFSAVRLNLFHFGIQTDPEKWNRQAIGDNNVVAGLQRLAALRDEHGFALMIAIWPRFTDDDVVDMNAMPGSPGELVVERLARMYGISTFRFSDYFEQHRASLPEPVNPRRFYTVGDWLHPNERGATIAAAALKVMIAELPTHEAVHGEVDPIAVEAARALGQKDPQHARVVLNLGNTLLQQGRVEEAIVQYRAALRMKPGLAEAHSNLGVALKSQGKLDEAIYHYRAALKLRPDLADAHNNLGVALARQGQLNEAIGCFEEALRLRPGFPDARKNLDASLRLQGSGR